MLSEVYEKGLKSGFTNAVIDEINNILINYNGTVMIPFYIHPPDREMFNYYLLESTDEFTKYDKVEPLIDKLFSEFNTGDHLCALIDGKNLSSVKFYIGRGMFSLSEALEYKDIVAINHLIYSDIMMDNFMIANEKVVLVSK